MELAPEMLVDAVLAVLLVAAIVASTIVYRRLGTIRDGQTELRALVDSLNTAVVDAQRSVGNLRQAALEVEERLGAKTAKAATIADELGMITEAGNNLADRIERGLTSGRATETGQGAPEPATAETQASKKQQQEILAALREAR